MIAALSDNFRAGTCFDKPNLNFLSFFCIIGDLKRLFYEDQLPIHLKSGVSNWRHAGHIWFAMHGFVAATCQFCACIRFDRYFVLVNLSS